MPFSINPYIYHWEAALFNRDVFDDVHQKHETNRRRKREVNYNHHSPHYGSTNVIEFVIKAHQRYKNLFFFFTSSSFIFVIFREFHIELREDPSSVFAPNILIENSDGPLDFDISRVYSGKLKGK